MRALDPGMEVQEEVCEARGDSNNSSEYAKNPESPFFSISGMADLVASKKKSPKSSWMLL